MKLSTLFFVLLVSSSVAGQTADNLIKLEDCYKKMEANYPMIKQRDLLSKSMEYSLDNVSKGYLPQLSINGQATYQSDVTKITIPGMNTPSPDKDQYRIYAELNQPITDLLVIKDQKKLTETNIQLRESNLETEIYRLKDRINQLYFGILLLDEQNQQNELLKKDLQTGLKKIQSAIQNGVEYQSSENKLKAEMIKADQRSIELAASRRSFLDMLGLFLNTELGDGTKLEKPVSPSLSKTINRPELKTFELQNTNLELQNRLIKAKQMPHLNFFIQGGIGKPSPVNALSTDASSYYIGGLRLNWNLTSLYTFNKEKKLTAIEQEIAALQKETFLFNTNLNIQQQEREIEKYDQLIQTDDTLIALRNSIKNTASAQLENGVISANDYLKEVNAEDQARQNKIIHQMQLLMTQFSYQNTTGN